MSNYKILKIDSTLGRDEKLLLIESVKSNDYYETNCECCNTLFKRRKSLLSHRKLDTFLLCCSCLKTISWASKTQDERMNIRNKREKTNFEKYGGTGFSSKELAEKTRRTLESKYGLGMDNPQKIQEFKEKTANTNLIRYGGTGFASEELLDKYRNTCEKVYGVRNVQELPFVLERRVKTMNDRYGVDYAAQNKQIRQKQIETNIKRYGGVSSSCDPNIEQKILETQIQKYGKLAFIGARALYEYDGITFDSSWELAFYVYHKDAGHSIIREPFSIVYCESNGKKHLYYPDFEMNGILYEIKGDFLLKEENLIDRNTFEVTDQTLAKMSCMNENNVVILKKEDLKACFSYMKEKFGTKWTKLFRRKNE